MSSDEKSAAPTSSKTDSANLHRALELEYETHFFKFSPKAMIDSIYNIITGVLEERFDQLKLKLTEEFQNEVSEQDVGIAVDSLKNEVGKTVGRNFAQFEDFVMHNVFRINHGILLPEHQIYDDPNFPTELDEERLREEIEAKELAIKNLRFENELLKAELVELDFVESYQEKLIKAVDDFAESMKKANDQKAEKERLLKDFLDSLQNIQF